MLPECRSNDYLYPTPKFNLKMEQVENFVRELEVLHGDFCECFYRPVLLHFFDVNTWLPNGKEVRYKKKRRKLWIPSFLQ